MESIIRFRKLSVHEYSHIFLIIKFIILHSIPMTDVLSRQLIHTDISGCLLQDIHILCLPSFLGSVKNYLFFCFKI